MATPTQLRSRVAGLVTLANGDLAALWRRLERAVDAEEALRDILPALIDTYGAAASVVAADWYDDLRAKQGVGGGFRADPADVPDSGTQALVGWALTESTDPQAFRTLIEGGLQRRIANFSRLTVTRSSIADPQADGWQRVGSGDSCPFCRLLISRGSVYSEATADFAAHDHDDCQAAPAFTGEPRPVRPYERSARYVEDDEQRAKENAKLRAYIKARGY